MRYKFLPPYSPDLNPIEEAFSAIKAHLRRVKDDILLAMSDRDDDTAVYLYIIDAVYSVTISDVAGWFQHSGYL